MNSHTNHRTPEFIILANDNNIHLYSFPSHLTRIIQHKINCIAHGIFEGLTQG